MCKKHDDGMVWVAVLSCSEDFFVQADEEKHKIKKALLDEYRAACELYEEAKWKISEAYHEAK